MAKNVEPRLMSFMPSSRLRLWSLADCSSLYEMNERNMSLDDFNHELSCQIDH